MRSTRLGLISAVMLAVVVIAGCDDGGGTAVDRAAAGGAPSATAQPTATGAPAGADASAACATMSEGAAKQVATAMSDLADTSGSAPKQKPSRATLDGAVQQLTATCAAA